ncbi:MAG: hypothetical protein OXJ56_16285 [Rhodospirillaceae bacterium]|nr:hypothetical protein [Rhodospirillaceae bacterium]
MNCEPGTVVLIGAAAAGRRPVDPGAGFDATGLMAEALRGALKDCGVAGLGPKIDWIGAARGLAQLPDAARRVGEAVGADPHTVAADVGIPQQTLINLAFEAIRSGRHGIAVVCGGEAKYRDDLARRAGVELPGHDQEGLVPDEEFRPTGEIVARPEIEIGAVVPVQQYAMIENARRAAHGWSLSRHRDEIAARWHGFNQVAQTNPRAAFGEPMSPEEIRDPAPANRPMAFPYTKWHSSQWSVDQAAALVLCSASTAVSLGVPRDRWVFPHAGLESSMSLSLSRRGDLHRWPAMAVLGAAAERHIGRRVADMDHIELYSCFPSAVAVQQSELSVDPDRVCTVTGGMGFAGGPLNNFVFQATVEMIDRVRSEPGTYGFVTAVSGLLTKPGLTVWSTDPPPAGLLTADLAAEAEAATAEVPLDEDPHGEGTVATYTVVYDGMEPSGVRAIVDLTSGTSGTSGSRAVAALDDPEVAADAVNEDLIGAPVTVHGTTLRV